jgi:HTH-type transcriptional regulator / antitoxin HigA
MNSLTYPTDWVSAPGETMIDMLDESSRSVRDLASHLGGNVGSLDALLTGEEALTGNIAVSLAAFFDTTVSFWIKRESQFRTSLKSMEANGGGDWLKKLPIADMVAYRWVTIGSASEHLIRCLNFFGCCGITEWQRRYGATLSGILFRKSAAFDSEVESVSAWLRQGERLAKLVDVQSWNSDRLRAQLPALRALSRVSDPSRFLPELTRLCSLAGVAVVIVRTPKKCPASGAARFISPQKAVIQLSFRHLSDDHFWFSFFHEIGHLLLHGDSEIHLEDTGSADGNEEREANEFAGDVLIPPTERARMLALGEDARPIIRFATQVGTSPGIVVGQMQYHGAIKHSRMNALKKRYTWHD